MLVHLFSPLVTPCVPLYYTETVFRRVSIWEIISSGRGAGNETLTVDNTQLQRFFISLVFIYPSFGTIKRTDELNQAFVIK